MQIGRRTAVAAASVTGALIALAAAASVGATPKVRDLPKITPSTLVVRLAAGTRYGASLITPTPNLTPSVAGWGGGQFVSHKGGKVRYETAALFWHDAQHEIDIISGPAMTLSPSATLAKPLSRNFDFAPYDPPSAVQRSTIAGRPALFFDATAPPPGVWTLVGANPPELRIDHDNAFRMAALTVRGKTVVIVIRAPAAGFNQFLPIATRLLASLQFPTG